jgi:hypothetical protein
MQVWRSSHSRVFGIEADQIDWHGGTIAANAALPDG